MAKNPSVQEKLREEIKSATAHDDSDNSNRISYDELMELPYLDQVIYESLRMNPPLTFSNRECSESIQLDGVKGHKIEIEKGLRVFIPILSIHHDSGLSIEAVSNPISTEKLSSRSQIISMIPNSSFPRDSIRSTAE